MIASGNHTIIYSWQKSALRNRFLTDEGCRAVIYSFLLYNKAYSALGCTPSLIRPAFPRCARAGHLPPGGRLGALQTAKLQFLLPCAKKRPLWDAAASYKNEKDILKKVEEQCSYFKVRARNISKSSLNMAIEVRVEETSILIEKIMEMDDIVNVSLVESDGNITG